MKTLSVEDIIGLVRTKYDEIGLNESEMISSTDDSDIHSVIRSCIGEA